MNAQTVIVGLIGKVFDANKDRLKEIYEESRRQKLDQLEKSEFDEAWKNATRPFYERCAALVFDTIANSAPELKERVIATIKDPSLAGYEEGTDFMYPSYIYMMAFYMYTGKKGRAYYGKQVDKLCNSTTQSWLNEWAAESTPEEADAEKDPETE